MIGDRRGRITVPDVLISVFILAALGALWPVVADSLDGATQYMNAGEIYIMRLLLPLMLLVMLAMVFAKASAGGHQ